MENKSAQWDGIITISLTLGEYMELCQKFERAEMAVELLEERDDIPKSIFNALDRFNSCIEECVVESGNSALEGMFDL